MLALLPTDGSDPLVRIDEIPEPPPAPGEALVEVEAFSINRGETLLLERPRPGWRPGKDIAGRVLKSAADGRGPAVGARVVGHPSQAGWAQFASVPTDALASLPEGVDAVSAAALPLAGLTALRLLRAAGQLPGTRVLLTGASGGVGHYVTELASAVGAEITAVTKTPERARRLLELGAAHAVADLGDARGPFDLVFESVGGESLPRALSLLRKGGSLIWFGQASRTPVTLDFFAYFDQTGSSIRHFDYEDSPCSDRLHPELGLIADWSQTGAALARMRDRRLRGNAVLRIPSPSQPDRTPDA